MANPIKIDAQPLGPHPSPSPHMPDTPDAMMRALVNSPPTTREDWTYLKKESDSTCQKRKS